jgi:hypothetical protein
MNKSLCSQRRYPVMVKGSRYYNAAGVAEPPLQLSASSPLSTSIQQRHQKERYAVTINRNESQSLTSMLSVGMSSRVTARGCHSLGRRTSRSHWYCKEPERDRLFWEHKPALKPHFRRTAVLQDQMRHRMGQVIEGTASRSSERHLRHAEATDSTYVPFDKLAHALFNRRRTQR